MSSKALRPSNQGPERMNVRVFALIAMTAAFGAIWSSDRQYQQAQVAAIQAARKKAALRIAVVAPRPVAARVDGFQANPCFSATTRLISQELFGPFASNSLENLFRRGSQAISRVDAEACVLRWQARKSLFFAKRRAAILIRQDMNWREIAMRLGRDAARQIEIFKSALKPAATQTR